MCTRKKDVEKLSCGFEVEENVIAKIHNFNHESTYSKNNSKKTVFGLGTFDLG